MSNLFTLKNAFDASERKPAYVNMFGQGAFSAYAHANYTSWLDEHFPLGGDQALSLEDMGALCSTWRLLDKRLLGRDCVFRFVVGERERRWVIPVIEGVLTQDYWDQFIAKLPMAEDE